MSARKRYMSSKLLCIPVLVTLALCGCLFVNPQTQDGVVDMKSTTVTARDVEVARQMGAPERVLESLEKGEWLYASDREFVRFAELAMDHMEKEHGIVCRAKWTDIPWVLKNDAEVTLIVAEGEYVGEELVVTIGAEDPYPCTDTWASVVLKKPFDELMSEALGQAMDFAPKGTWAYACSIDAKRTTTNRIVGYVDVCISPALLPTRESFDELTESILATLEATHARLGYFIVVPSSEPQVGGVTVGYGLEASAKGGDALAYSLSGKVGDDR